MDLFFSSPSHTLSTLFAIACFVYAFIKIYRAFKSAHIDPSKNAEIIQPGEKEDRITMANLLLTIPHGEASVTDQGDASLYKVDVKYPNNGALIIAAWLRTGQDRTLSEAVNEEKEISKDVGLILVGEENIDQQTVLLSFNNKDGGLNYSLISFISTATGTTELMLQLTPSNNFDKNKLLEILKNVQPVTTALH